MASPGLFSSQFSPPGEIERSLAKQGYLTLLGVDEAGRGALFGPVYAGAVVLPDATLIPPGIRDSKQLEAPAREELELAIKASARAWGVGTASASEVDSLGILPATFLAMRRAIQQCLERLCADVDLVVVDGPLAIAGYSGPQKPVVKGDSRSLHIAAASILAKVGRDREVTQLHEQWPKYGLARHKGYGTASHYEAIAHYGLTPLHRRSFCHLPEAPAARPDSVE